MSEDMSPYCSAHDEWLIMKPCMFAGYHDANNVSNVGGDQVTQLNFKKRFIVLFTLFYGHGDPLPLRCHSFCGGCYAITRRLQQYERPYQP